ncbi:MAG: helix-turn-helix domain-containing protein, partial [Agathobacter rectalis]
MQQDIIKKIKRIRREKGISQIEMADRLSINKTAYTRLESGETSTWA